jgi:hypothetical protein
MSRTTLAIRAGLALALATVALFVAGCGSSSTGATGRHAGAAPDSQALAWARCMRSHGVPDMPDPGATRPSGPVSTYLGIALPPSISPQSPAFESANHICQSVLSSGAAAKPPITESVKRAAIANAECMREHGVPNFPDPTFPPGGGIAQSGFDPQSPAFEQAARACKQ